MGKQRYPHTQVGRPAERVTAKWELLEVRRCKSSNVALLQRTRTTETLRDTSYAVVFSPKAITANGVVLRATDAIPYGSEPNCRRTCKARSPEAWHSDRAEAEGKFRTLVRRGGWRW